MLPKHCVKKEYNFHMLACECLFLYLIHFATELSFIVTSEKVQVYNRWITIGYLEHGSRECLSPLNSESSLFL